MFDIGFWELVLIAIIALLVVGPERLPRLAYEAGTWFGRLQRYLRKFRYQIERELHEYEFQQNLEKEQRELMEETRSLIVEGKAPGKQSTMEGENKDQPATTEESDEKPK